MTDVLVDIYAPGYQYFQTLMVTCQQKADWSLFFLKSIPSHTPHSILVIVSFFTEIQFKHRIFPQKVFLMGQFFKIHKSHLF